jgi:hypothetical protein
MVNNHYKVLDIFKKKLKDMYNFLKNNHINL